MLYDHLNGKLEKRVSIWIGKFKFDNKFDNRFKYLWKSSGKQSWTHLAGNWEIMVRMHHISNDIESTKTSALLQMRCYK